MGRILKALLIAGALVLTAGGASAAPAQKRPAAAKRAPPPKAAPAPEAPEADGVSESSWTAEAGAKTAAAVIARCTDGGQAESCAHVAFLRCQQTFGSRDAQVLLNCAGFDRAAWDDRLAAAMDKLQSVMTQTRRTQPAPSAMAASQKKWRSWSEADCETQTKATRGAELHPMEVNLCLSDHAAPRALELDQLAALWGR
jgi:uncharacterized protein YecT (DUF1311 family)